MLTSVRFQRRQHTEFAQAQYYLSREPSVRWRNRIKGVSVFFAIRSPGNWLQQFFSLIRSILLNNVDCSSGQTFSTGILGSLRNDNGYGNDNAKKQWYYWLKEEEMIVSHVRHASLNIFFPYSSKLLREITKFEVLRTTWTNYDESFSLAFYFKSVRTNPVIGHFAFIVSYKQDWIIPKYLE